jgi:hypothetical protein
VGRVDWVVNSKHSLYGRYFVDDYTLAAFFNPHDILVTALSGNVERAQTFVLGETYTINPSTVNSAHFTFGRRTDDRGRNTSGADVKEFLPIPPPDGVVPAVRRNLPFTAGAEKVER